MATPVIVSATRTAIGTLGGALAQVPATKLGSIAVREAIRRARLEPAQVDEVILGHVLPAGLGLNPGRVAALDAGVPKEVPSYTVNKACGSGLKAVVLAAQLQEGAGGVGPLDVADLGALAGGRGGVPVRHAVVEPAGVPAELGEVAARVAGRDAGGGGVHRRS